MADKIWEGDVGNVINQLGKRKAVCADNITAEFLRRVKNWLVLLLTDILNGGQYNNRMRNACLQALRPSHVETKSH